MDPVVPWFLTAMSNLFDVVDGVISEITGNAFLAILLSGYYLEAAFLIFLNTLQATMTSDETSRIARKVLPCGALDSRLRGNDERKRVRGNKWE